MALNMKTPLMKMLLILISVVASAQLAFADAVAERAAQIESLTEAQISAMNTGDKLKLTRDLGLYMTDILPELGNPYAHLFEFINNHTKVNYDSAMARPSQHFSLNGNACWLPTALCLSTTPGALNADRPTKEAIIYLQKWIGTFKVATIVQTFYQYQIMTVEKPEEALDADTLAKFDKAWRFYNYIVQRYEAAFALQTFMAAELLTKKRRAFLALGQVTLENMAEHIEYVKKPGNAVAVNKFMRDMGAFLKKIKDREDGLGVATERLPAVQAAADKIFNISDASYITARKAFMSMDLPESSGIMGADEGFEIGTRITVGFDVLVNSFTDVVSRW